MIRLAAVCCQYDRERYKGAIERLIALLQSLEGVDARLVIVDNAREGDWQHEITARLVHIGGDNSCREFSAFEKGLGYLAGSDWQVDVYAFITDAFLAYGDEYLELITGDMVQETIDLEACIGWVDSFGEHLHALGYDYNAWMRTSLFFVPAVLLPKMLPLRTPLDVNRIFSDDASAPFHADCGLSRRLQKLILAWLTTAPNDISLDEVWHSRFDLDDTTIDAFQAKACCILREQLLSAGMQRQGIHCFDFRFVRTLVERGVHALAPSQRELYAWLGWRRFATSIPLRYHIEEVSFSEELVHGEPAELAVVGWIFAGTPVREVLVRLRNGATFYGSCDLPRPDVLAAFPQLSDKYHGFEVRAVLDCLPPGEYEVELAAPAVEMVETLGRLRVLQRCDLRAEKVFIPRRAPRNRPAPISLDGTVLSSRPLVEVSVLWNGEPTGIQPVVAEVEQRANGLFVSAISLIGEVGWQERPQNVLELVLRDDDGDSTTWRTFAAMIADEVPPHVLSVRHIDGWNPRTSTTSVFLQGAVLLSGDDERLLLQRQGTTLWEGPFDGPRSHDGRVAWFELRHELPGIPPGRTELSIAIQRPGDEPQILTRWEALVTPLYPELRVDHLEVRPPDEHCRRRVLSVGGWVLHHTVVEQLRLEIAGTCTETVSLNVLREDLAGNLGQQLVRQQGFFAELQLDLGAGEYPLRIMLPGGQVLWERLVVIPETATEVFRVRSETLSRLVDQYEVRFLAAVCIEGTVTTQLSGVLARLFANHELVDSQLLDGEWFMLRYSGAPGPCQLRVVFEAGGRTLYDSGVLDAVIECPAELPELGRTLDTFLKTFDISGRLGLVAEGSLLEPLLARNQRCFADYARMLHDIAGVLQHSGDTGPPIVAERLPDRPLRVLFACWNVPCLRHGGGVFLSNLLKELSTRHELTVIYCYNDYETDWIDDVRSSTRRVIGVPRYSRPSSRHRDGLILKHLWDEYVPELRTAIDRELRTGEYDLVEYQYCMMLPHVSSADLPQVLSVLEEPFSAALATYSSETVGESEKLRRLDHLLRLFYLSTVALPGRFRHLLTVTEEDASLIRRFQRSTEVHVNPIGVDTERFAVAEEVRPTSDEPRFVFLGNFRHPPNVDAAVWIVSKVMPRVWQRCPDARCDIVGGFPTPAVRRLADDSRVRVTGFVDDFRPYLWQGTAFLAPIFSGSGMRVKLLEAMACGIPVIATPLAVNGLQALAGEHYLEAGTVSEFAEQAVRCLEDPEAAGVGRRGRELVIAHHSVVARAREREAVWQRMLDTHAGDSVTSPKQ